MPRVSLGLMSGAEIDDLVNVLNDELDQFGMQAKRVLLEAKSKTAQIVSERTGYSVPS
jgi:hypothetical protein